MVTKSVCIRVAANASALNQSLPDPSCQPALSSGTQGRSRAVAVGLVDVHLALVRLDRQRVSRGPAGGISMHIC